MSNIAVVTGAGRGLGRLVSARLAARGYTVLCTDVDQASAEATASALGHGSFAMAQDVRDADSHRRVAHAATERGRLVLWVNNAGVLRTASAWDHSDADVRLQVEVNVLGVMWGSRAAVDEMRQCGGGQIINVASMSALLPVPGLAVYAATKHAVLGFTTSLQGDLDREALPIKVSAICPDAVDTDLVRDVADNKESALLFSGGRLLAPDHVADRIVSVIDDYQLMVMVPRRRGLLAMMMAPFPEMELRILGQLAKIGARRQQKRLHGDP